MEEETKEPAVNGNAEEAPEPAPAAPKEVEPVTAPAAAAPAPAVSLFDCLLVCFTWLLRKHVYICNSATRGMFHKDP